MNNNNFKKFLFNDYTYFSKLNITCQHFKRCLEYIKNKILNHECIFDTLNITKEDNFDKYNLYFNNKIFTCRDSLELYEYSNFGKNLLKFCPTIKLNNTKCIYFDQFITNISNLIDNPKSSKNFFFITEYEKFEDFRNENGHQELLLTSPVFIIFILLIFLSSFGILAVIYMAFFDMREKSNQNTKNEVEEIEL